MSSFSEKTPPAFDKKMDVYSKWKKKFTIWQSITDVADTKQGGYLILRLDDSTQEAVLESVSTNDIKTDQGVTKILPALDKMFEVDKSVTAYEAYEDFECYKRPANLSIKDYCAEFQSKLAKVQTDGTTLGDPFLAYLLIKSANLSLLKRG